PSTLRESLMARLDRLGPAREVAQVLSVVGREASTDLLRAVSLLDYDELEAGLERLVGSDLVRRRDVSAQPTYRFKHWLVQDVAAPDGTRRRPHRSADYKNAFGFAQRLMGLAVDSARGSRDGTREAAAHRALGSTLFYLGDDPATARSHLEQVIASQSLERT